MAQGRASSPYALARPVLEKAFHIIRRCWYPRNILTEWREACSSTRRISINRRKSLEEIWTVPLVDLRVEEAPTPLQFAPSQLFDVFPELFPYAGPVLHIASMSIARPSNQEDPTNMGNRCGVYGSLQQLIDRLGDLVTSIAHRQS